MGNSLASQLESAEIDKQNNNQEPNKGGDVETTQNANNENANETIVETQGENNNSEANASIGATENNNVEQKNGETQETKPETYDLSKFKEAQEDFETPDELLEAYQKLLNKEPENPFANDWMKSLNGYAEAGHNINEIFLRQIGADWSSMDVNNPDQARQIIEAKLRLDKPNYDDAKINYLMKKHAFDEDAYKEQLEKKYDTEEEITAALAEKKAEVAIGLSIEAEEAQAELLKHQEALKSSAPSQEEQAAKRQANIEEYSAEVNKVTKDITTYKTKLGEEEYEVELGGEDLKQVRMEAKLAASDPAKFWEQYGGSAQGIVTFLMQNKFQERLMQKMSEDILEKGKYAATKEMKNHTSVPVPNSGAYTSGSRTKAIADAAEAAYNN